MSYSGRGGHGYGGQQRRGFFGLGKGKKAFNRNVEKAKKAFEKRSERSKTQDLVRLAEIAPSLTAYLKTPNQYDFPGVDMPKLSKAQQAIQMAKISLKEPSEIIVEDKSLADVSKQKRSFKVVKKDKVKEETEQQLSKAEEALLAELTSGPNSPLLEQPKHRMPSQQEILETAQQMWMADNNQPKFGGFLENVSAPERIELAEEGYLQRAKLALMTKSDTKNERAVLDYVQNIRVELQKIGFDVVPISGFNVSDVSF